MITSRSRLPEFLQKYGSDLHNEWVREQLSIISRHGVIRENELRDETRRFLALLQETLQKASVEEFSTGAWDNMRQLLSEISRSRGLQGFSPTETALFVLSLKRPLCERLKKEFSNDAQALYNETWVATELLEKLALHTSEAHLKAREEVISRQQQDLLELSTPVVKLWEGILVLPMIGTLDSARTQVVMESLLQRIVETGSDVAIIDITGVPTVDTLVAQHLLKTVTAARLMGADCIISGIRPQIAQTIVHLGVELGDVTTKSNISDAFALALRQRGLTVCKQKSTSAPKP
ncbi:MAG TPA: STAS domain-containing protein [Verrucomicrobiae bacterium]